MIRVNSQSFSLSSTLKKVNVLSKQPPLANFHHPSETDANDHRNSAVHSDFPPLIIHDRNRVNVESSYDDNDNEAV